ncbi:unnamed protein product [Fraxinus pennsylvanica]|uniref:Thioredoxin domain-containing protein n=1 Tax=Fraxinus pennsylvanica TaxID=56036 RepID=A0AAD2AHB8_9LAMI|nr:unnamed protein product [Fraxinus pennsylvanica]
MSSNASDPKTLPELCIPLNPEKTTAVVPNEKVSRDWTKGSISAVLSIIAALSIIFLVGRGVDIYLGVSTYSSIVVDKSFGGDLLLIDFNISFPALPCEFASVGVSDFFGTNMLDISKMVHKYPIYSNLKPTGSEFQLGTIAEEINYDEQVSPSLNAHNFDKISHQHPILVVKFYAPWCYWSKRLKPSWAEAAKTIRERYDPEIDGRIFMGMVDCNVETELCRRHHIDGYPFIRIFRNGSDIRDECDDDSWHQCHESYYGKRDTNSLVKAMEDLVAPISLQLQKVASDSLPAKNKDDAKKPAPLTGGCRIEGNVNVNKVPGNLIISASSAAHSFDASQLNMSHIISHFSFDKRKSRRLMRDKKRMLHYFGGSHDWSRLDGKSYISNPSDSYANITIEHYLQVVKTEVMTRSHKLFEEYDYTTHSSFVRNLDFPVAKFHFEPSKMKIFINQSKSYSRFITNVCAILGSVATVVGILHVIMYNTMRAKAFDTESKLVGV